jgi:hypothetical protein
MMRIGVIGAIVAVAGAALRVVGAAGEPWIDEIWTVTVLRTLRSPVEIFTAFRHDNNHWLNSLSLYPLVKAQAPPWTWRLPALLAGCLATPLAMIVAANLTPAGRRRAAVLLAGVLFAACHFMVVYGSEARGYAGSLSFGLLSLLAVVRGRTLLNR